MIFVNRAEAGTILAAKLRKYREENAVVMAIPRGGVPVAFEIAKSLGLPMDLALIKKIGHPNNKEYAIGATSLTDYFIVPFEKVSQEYVTAEVQKIRKRLNEMHSKFMGSKPVRDLQGKTVIVVDDGVATGNTLMATLQVLRKGNPFKIVVAVPVASTNAVRKLKPEADELICISEPEEFYGVGAFYKDFDQVTDEEVMDYFRLLQSVPE